MRIRLSTALALAAMLAGGAASAHEGHAQKPAAASATAPAAEPIKARGTHDAKAYFTDTELLTQEGRAVRFYSDVLADRVVLLNVIYTNCEDACPLITRKLKEVRDALGEPLAQRVHFISISSDPERDSPQALAAFAREQGAADPNWIYLTGKRENVDLVLTRLGQLSRSPEEHSTLLIAGDVPNKRWSKIRPDAPAAAIAERLRLLADPAAAH